METTGGRRFKAALCLSIVVLAVVGAMSIRSGRNTPDLSHATTAPADHLAEQPTVAAAVALLEFCSGTNMDAACMESALIEAVRKQGPDAAMAALAAFTVTEPEAAIWCHGGAHGAGAEAYKLRGSRSIPDLMNAGNDTCLMGFLHGVLDGYSTDGATTDDLAELMPACRLPSGDQNGLCFDAFGHAGWNAAGSLPEAVELCAKAPQDWTRHACEAGILMQMFAPAHEEPTYPIEQAPTRLPEVCATWPEVKGPGSGRSQTGCWLGGAYLLVLPISDMYFQTGRPDITADLTIWQERVRTAGNVCRAMTDPANAAAGTAARTCAAGMGRHIFGAWTGYDIALAADMCAALDDLEELCIWEAAAVGASHRRLREDGTLDMNAARLTPIEVLTAAGLADRVEGTSAPKM